MVEIPKRGGWGGGSAIWEKFPNNPVFFSDAFPYAFYGDYDDYEDCEVYKENPLNCNTDTSKS